MEHTILAECIFWTIMLCVFQKAWTKLTKILLYKSQIENDETFLLIDASNSTKQAVHRLGPGSC